MIKAKQYFIDFHWKITIDAKTGGWVSQQEIQQEKHSSQKIMQNMRQGD